MNMYEQQLFCYKKEEVQNKKLTFESPKEADPAEFAGRIENMDESEDMLAEKQAEAKCVRIVDNDNLNKIIKTSEDMEIVEQMNIRQQLACATGVDPNCGECCAIFTNEDLREAFGYELETATCACHDICVEDVRDICVATRTLRQCVPCNPNAAAGCRGGFLPDGAPTVQSWRVLCADENLSPATGCDRIVNNVEFEVVLRYGTSNTLAVVTPSDTFECFFFEFARFPSGVFYTNDLVGLNQFRNELSLIDGSCKVIIIEAVRIVAEGNNCILEIDYRIIDKLWKHANLLVSAIKPYSATGEGENITVSQIFNQGQAITACESNGICPGAGPLA